MKKKNKGMELKKEIEKKRGNEKRQKEDQKV